MSSEKRICQVCGSSEVIEKGGKWICRSCDTVWHFDNELDQDDISYLSSVNNALSDLKLDPPRFDDAETKFESLIKEYPKASEAYWGLLRAKYGIKYVTDSNNKSIPICFKSKYVDFRKDNNYKKALELAEDENLKKKYISEGDRIADTWKKWEEEAKQLDFDVFLSFKSKDENGNLTEDSALMQDLYTYLTEKHIKVFYAPVSMREFAGKEYYDAYIFNALEKSQVLIVCGTKPAYFTSPWVESEWSRYLSQIEIGEKHKDSLFLIYGDFNPSLELSKRIAHRQSLNVESRTLFPDLFKGIETILSSALKKSPLERIFVKIKEQGIKRSSIQSNVQLEDVNVKRNKKSATLPHNNFHFKNIRNGKNESYTPGMEDSLNAASMLLYNNSFDEAYRFYSDCLSEDNTNGKAWVGLFACKAHDSQIYLDLDMRLPFKKRHLKPKECNIISNMLPDIEKMLEHTPSKEEGSRILLFLAETVLESFLLNLSHKRTYPYFLFNFYKLINSYDDKSRLIAKKLIEANLSKLFNIYNLEIFQLFAKELVNTLSTDNVDEYLNLLEKIIVILDKNEDYDSAKEWNAIKLSHYEGDFKSLKRAIFYSFNVSSFSKFVKQCKYLVIKDETFSLIEQNINKMSKQDARKFFRFIMGLEKRCLLCSDANNRYLSNAKKLFSFIIKYKFKGRKHYLNWHFKNSKYIAFGNKLSFFLDILNYSDNEGSDFYIDKLLSFGNLLLDTYHFDNAELCFQEVSKYQDNNFEGLKGIMLSKIGYSSTSAKELNIWGLDFGEFEKTLSFAPNAKSQQTFVNQLISSCLEKLKEPSFDSNCTYFIVTNFKELIKYSSEDIKTIKDKYIDPMAFLCLHIKAFESAKELADLSLECQPRYNDKAHFVMLLASLRCADENDFIYCKEFNKNNKEYKALLTSCSNNNNKLQKYTDLADKNFKFRGKKKRKYAKKIEKIKEIKPIYLSYEEREKIRIKRVDTFMIVFVLMAYAVFAFFEIWAIVNAKDVYVKVFGALSIGLCLFLLWLFGVAYKEDEKSILAIVLQIILTIFMFFVFATQDKLTILMGFLPHIGIQIIFFMVGPMVRSIKRERRY